MKLPAHFRLGPLVVAVGDRGVAEIVADWNKTVVDLLAAQMVEIAMLRAKAAYFNRYSQGVGELIVEEYERWRSGG